MWKILEEIDARIEKLRVVAGKAARPLPAESRELFTALYQEVSFYEDDLQEQRQTFYNGDRDTLVLQRFAVKVSIELPEQLGQRIALQKVTAGWTAMDSWLARGSVRQQAVLDPGFDFQWNYVVNSRQSQYSRSSCMSDMLVGLDKGQMLDFRVPLVLPKSESVEFRVQPLRYLFPNSEGKVPGTKYFVGFIGLGYRSMP